MKILYIVHSTSWRGGGAFFHAYHLGKQMVSLGNDVTLLSTSQHNRLRFSCHGLEGIQLIEAPDLLFGTARNGWDIYNALQRIRFLCSKKFDIVHCLDCRPVVIFPGLFLKYVQESKLVLEWLDWFGRGGTASERAWKIRIFMEPIELFFEEKFRKYADGTIGLGIPLTDRAKSLGLKRNIITIFHGCDTEKIKVIALKEAKAIVNIEKNKLVVGYLGRMRKDVGVLFVKVIRELRNKFALDVYGLIIGNSALDFAQFLTDDIEKYILVTGWISYELMNAYLCSCEVLILPFKGSIARNNIWPSKLNDYLAVGRPVISTKLKVIEGLFNEYNCGILCDDTPEELAKGCHRLLTNDHLRNEMGKNSRMLADEILSWKNISEKTLKFYEDILGG